MSSTYIATFVSILSVVLPLLGVHVGGEALTTTLQTLFIVVSGLWVLKERFKKGGVNIFGVKQ